MDIIELWPSFRTLSHIRVGVKGVKRRRMTTATMSTRRRKIEKTTTRRKNQLFGGSLGGGNDNNAKPSFTCTLRAHTTHTNTQKDRQRERENECKHRWFVIILLSGSSTTRYASKILLVKSRQKICLFRERSGPRKRLRHTWL